MYKQLCSNWGHRLVSKFFGLIPTDSLIHSSKQMALMAFARWGAELVFARWDTVFDFDFHYRQFCYAGFDLASEDTCGR